MYARAYLENECDRDSCSSLFPERRTCWQCEFCSWWMEENALQLVGPAQVGGLLVQYRLLAPQSSLGIAQRQV